MVFKRFIWYGCIGVVHPSLLSELGYMSEDGKIRSNLSATSSGGH
ncbi:hypothetical protein [Bartonella grahamii]|nr:hypothetical protein [Bartonella grahamii]